MPPAKIVAFQQTVTNYYQQHGRHDMPWRQPGPAGFDPYRIMVSELMLQQTQVSRVIPKYDSFLISFPTVANLAAAPLGAVLSAWSGLGYNRRAKFLWQAAAMILTDYNGRFPQTIPELMRLPGVGVNTAGAIMAYAFDQPVVFIETNIRSVFIHHFFSDDALVPDNQISDLVQATLPSSSPRLWYWALMDYGSYLKQTTGNAARRSTSYARQSSFNGSPRQLRGQVIRLLTERPYTMSELKILIADDRLNVVLQALQQEGLITRRGNQLSI